jgi:predicted DNA-binding protein YlxM (UPF0122 family)
MLGDSFCEKDKPPRGKASGASKVNQLSTQTSTLEELVRLYFDEQLSLNAIAECIGVSVGTIGNRLRAAGYPLRPRGAAIGQFKHPEVNTADLVQAWRENAKLTAIAKHFHISRPAVVYRLKQEGVQLPQRKHKVYLPDEEIIRLYVDENRTLAEIAKHFGVGQTTIHRKLTSLGVEIRARTAHMKDWHAAQKAKLAEAERIRSLPKGGRPPEDPAVITRIRELLKLGWPMPKIARQLNNETGKHRTPNAYRYLLRSHLN